jgi:hypothetical protein
MSKKSVHSSGQQGGDRMSCVIPRIACNFLFLVSAGIIYTSALLGAETAKEPPTINYRPTPIFTPNPVDFTVVPPFNADRPGSTQLTERQTVELMVISSFPEETTFQWFKDNQPLIDESNPFLKIDHASEEDSGVYYVVATNGDEDFSSAETEFSVFPPVEFVNLSTRVETIENGTRSEIFIRATLGTTYELQSSPDMKEWETIPNTSFVGFGEFKSFEVAPVSASLNQFYRYKESGYPEDEIPDGSTDSEATSPSPNPLADAVDLGEGWKWIPWFGAFKDFSFPWVLHEYHGWLYFGNGNLNTGQFFYDLTLGWMWTDRRRYPHIYSFIRNSWLLYEPSSTLPRKFADMRLGERIEFFISYSPDVYIDSFYNDFNITNTIIDEHTIIPGPYRDDIPSIDNPQFLTIPEVDYMEELDILISVTSGGETRGYPFRILNWHEVVNTKIGENAFVVTFCPLCGSAVVFDARVNGSLRTFGVSGLLHKNNLLMFDRESDSLWSQFTLQSVAGPMMKTRLKWLPSEQITWRDWKEKFPDGKLLSTDTGFTRRYDINPYALYAEDGKPPSGPRLPIRDDLPDKEWVWGITIGEIAKAYPLNRLPDGEPVRDVVDGVELELVLDAEARFVSVVIAETREPLDNGFGSFWFSWQDFFRETLVYLAS